MFNTQPNQFDKINSFTIFYVIFLSLKEKTFITNYINFPIVLPLYCFVHYTIAQQDLACAAVSAPDTFVRNSAPCQSYYYCNAEISQDQDYVQRIIYLMLAVSNVIKRHLPIVQNVLHLEYNTFQIQSNAMHYRCVNGQQSRIQCAHLLTFDQNIG